MKIIQLERSKIVSSLVKKYLVTSKANQNSLILVSLPRAFRFDRLFELLP